MLRERVCEREHHFQLNLWQTLLLVLEFTCPRNWELKRNRERKWERNWERNWERTWEKNWELERETGATRERNWERIWKRTWERNWEWHNETVEDTKKETRQLVLFTQVCTGLPCFVHDRYLSKVDLNIIGDMAVTNIDSSNVNLEWHVDSEVAWCPVLNHTYLRNLQGTCTILPRVNQGACTRSYS